MPELVWGTGYAGAALVLSPQGIKIAVGDQVPVTLEDIVVRFSGWYGIDQGIYQRHVSVSGFGFRRFDNRFVAVTA